MKLIISLFFLTQLSFADSHIVCFPGKVGGENIDKLCFDKTKVDENKTKEISVDNVGISELAVSLVGLEKPLTIFARRSTFNKVTNWKN